MQEEKNSEVKWIQWCAEGKAGEFFGHTGDCCGQWHCRVCLFVDFFEGGWRGGVAAEEEFFNAGGGRMEYHGAKKVCCEFEGWNLQGRMRFQVSDAWNQLVSGARVQFDPQDKDNDTDVEEEESKVRAVIQKGSQALVDRGEYHPRTSCRGSGNQCEQNQEVNVLARVEDAEQEMRGSEEQRGLRG